MFRACSGLDALLVQLLHFSATYNMYLLFQRVLRGLHSYYIIYLHSVLLYTSVGIGIVLVGGGARGREQRGGIYSRPSPRGREIGSDVWVLRGIYIAWGMAGGLLCIGEFHAGFEPHAAGARTRSGGK